MKAVVLGWTATLGRWTGVVAVVLMASPGPAPLVASSVGIADVTAEQPTDALDRSEAVPTGDSDLDFDLDFDLDLGQTVALALMRNPGLRAERERRLEVAGRVEEVAADAWPEVTVVSSWNRARSPALLNSPDFEDIVDQLPGGFEPREQELTEIGVEVQQTLYNGGALGAAIRLAERVRLATDAQIAVAELDVGAAAGEAFFRCLAAGQAVAVVRAQEAARTQALAVVEARYDLGDATELERLRARAAQAEVAPAAARAEGRVAVARTDLKALLDLPVAANVRCGPGDEPTASAGAARDSARTGPLGPDWPILPTDVDWGAHAVATRPELRDLAEQDLALDAQRVIAQADARPRLELNGAYGREARRVDDLSGTQFDDWRISLDMRWRVFDGGRRRGRLAQIASQQAQTQWRKQDLDNQVRAETTAAREAYRAAHATLVAARISADAAQEAQRVAAETFALGVALLTDVLDAQELALRAQLEAVEASADVGIAATRLARALGQLPTQDGVAASFAFFPSETP